MNIESNRNFVTTWRTDKTRRKGSSDKNQISLPLVKDGEYSFAVEWGDGNLDEINAWDDPNVVHTYEKAGLYKVQISGKITDWSFSESADSYKIIEVSNWGPLAFGNTSKQFFRCINLSVTAMDVPDLSKTTSLRGAFSGCKEIQDISNLNNWNTSNITDMREMFEGARMFNSDISGWDTSNVTNMSGMFSGADSFDQNISSWCISKVEDMMTMFMYSKSFNQDIGKWDTSSVTNMDMMFEQARIFNQDISMWDVSKVDTMREMFRDAPLFNADISKWNITSLRDMSAMFSGATSFNQKISNWDVSEVLQASEMFSDATAFDQDLSTWNVQKFEGMYNMFNNSGLSTKNYDLMLISWANQTPFKDRVFNMELDAGKTKFSPGVAAEARKRLISEYGWTISDGGSV